MSKPPRHGSVPVDVIKCVAAVILSVFKAVWSSIRPLLFFLSPSYKCIENDVILITGGGKGIGRYIAVELAKHSPKQVSA